jgi:large subunit ribosomal protein L34
MFARVSSRILVQSTRAARTFATPAAPSCSPLTPPPLPTMHVRLHEAPWASPRTALAARIDELCGWGAAAPTLLPLLDGDGDAGAGNVPLLAIKRVYQPSKIKRQRKHGFLSRIATKAGRNVIQRRKDKGRHLLSI